jgi:hypothetical protein
MCGIESNSGTANFLLVVTPYLLPKISMIICKESSVALSRTSDRIDLIVNLQSAACPFSFSTTRMDFLEANNQLWIKEPALSEWRKQADALSKALNQLADNPSANNLTMAKALLASFQFQFKKWMQSEGLEQPYQVEVWANRLATLERLLLYGERTLK